MDHCIDTQGWIHVEWDEDEGFETVKRGGEVDTPPGSPARASKVAEAVVTPETTAQPDVASSTSNRKKKGKKVSSRAPPQLADPDPVSIARAKVLELFNKKKNKSIRNNFAFNCAEAEARKGNRKKEKAYGAIY